MNLNTTYLGLKLAHPIMPGASPLVDDLDAVRELADAGASAIVMHSLFEEQLVREQLATYRAVDVHAEAFPEALSYLPSPSDFALGPDQYLEQIRRIRESVNVPVIASLNGVTPGGWLEHAKLMQQAGAHAIELNVYYLPTDASESAQAVEDRVVEMATIVKANVTIPVAVKLSPFYSAPAHLARRLDQAGIDGLVIFNRFYQPDLDIDNLEVLRRVNLSNSSELLLRLRWLAILSPSTRASLAVTGGVHTATDAVKAIMTGAHAVQIVSALLLNGPGYLRTIVADLSRWLQAHEYASLDQMRGCMNLQRCPDPAAYERANYMHVLQSWMV